MLNLAIIFDYPFRYATWGVLLKSVDNKLLLGNTRLEVFYHQKNKLVLKQLNDINKFTGVEIELQRQ